MAGSGERDFKRRIRSITNTEQITAAMEMVAAAKLRQAEEAAESSRPYADKLAEVLSRLSAVASDVKHPLLERRETVNNTTYIVVTGDRGLCGAFNSNVVRAASEALEQETREVENGICGVGRRGRDFFRKRGFKMQGEFVNLGDDITFTQAKEIGQFIIQLYEEGATDEVYLLYAKFINVLRQEPTLVKLLPIEPPQEEKAVDTEQTGYIADYLYEPGADAILTALLPRYVESQVYHAMLESKASEHGARMTAMGNATQNARELIDELTLQMNKARQAAITSEILEIVGGAEALRKGGN
ncbi:MAG: ATP synthase F1 subunit gamma [Syntrophothermaceae bacterium]|jgi:F-type H+-transporting ATPase subunit gamma